MAKASQLRRDKRAAVKKLKKTLPRNPSPTNPLEVPHLRKLEADLDQLGNAFNHNTQIHNHALTVAEMRINITQRAMNDIVRGTVYTTEIDGAQTIDWSRYTTEFGMCMLMAEFASWLARISTQSKTESPLIMPGYEDAQVFGGSP